MLISYEEERKLTRTLLAASGMREDEADLAGEVVTHSDFTGVYSHGLSRITLYLRQLAKGSLKARPEMKTLVDSGPVMAFDCDNGSGIVAVNRVYDALLPRAREFGVAIGTGRHGANIGCGSYYGWRAAEDKVLCMVCANTFASMAPFGGADLLIGTNPIIVAVPTGEEYPMVLDISTSGVAFGKILAAAREGKPIPAGWANDIDGRPTTDSSAAYTVLPIAEHKGYGLAVMVDVFSAVLAGAAFGTDIGRVGKLETENTGFCVILVDPSKFMPIEEFEKSADAYVRMMKYSRPAEGVKEIFMPGEIEYKKFKENREKGFEVSEALGEELCELAAKLGLVPEGSDFETLMRAL